ncbi:hypothetical protein ACFVUS_23970 [Nocardia sp. NPDC058058]|uniref:hypothetical protein n=1 Tax=Nocardia sp. NPDC058058 TaxID=3346317 RepID=UPI0036DD9FAB
MSGPDVGEKSFASTSLSAHLVRGLVGFGSLIGSLALTPFLGVGALLLLPVGIIALRGCPMCWLIGLAQTISGGRLRRSCTGDSCRLVTR